jgi:hypothetical protein
VLALLLASSALQAQTQSVVLSEEDEAEILESLLELEMKSFLDSEFGHIRTFSSTNIGSVSARQLVKHGFSLIGDREIQKGRIDHVIEYLVIRNIDLRKRIAVVKVSAVTEGRPCFAPAFYRERSFSYVFRKNADQWVGRLLKRSVPFPFTKRVATVP